MKKPQATISTPHPAIIIKAWLSDFLRQLPDHPSFQQLHQPYLDELAQRLTYEALIASEDICSRAVTLVNKCDGFLTLEPNGVTTRKYKSIVSQIRNLNKALCDQSKLSSSDRKPEGEDK